MKKIYTLITAMLLAMTATTLSACYWDDDEELVYTLEGTWKGYMSVSSFWEGANYQTTYTEITFLRNPYRYKSGEGYWVDYYSRAPWDYVANHIEWTVEAGSIYVYFVEEDYEVAIHDYRLDGYHLVGWLRDGDNDVEFRLTQTSSPNWSSYDHWGYDGWYNNWYTRGNASDAKSAEKPRRVISQS